MSPRPIRLCVVTPAHWMAFMGGAQYQIECLIESLLPSNRYDISYVARRVAADFQPQGYRIVAIGRTSAVPRLGYLMDAVPLSRALRKLQPDVIYQRVACGYTGVVAHYARHHNARLIWHVSSDTDVQPENLRAGSNAVRRWLEKRSIEYGIRHARHIVAQTERQAQLLERNYGRRADAVIRNFHPQPTETIDKSGPISVLWVANLKPLKQPEVFVRLAAQLRDLKDARFIMVGAAPRYGSSQWSDAVTQSIRATPNLDYLGERSQSDVNELLARAHVFVNTSEYEGFPNTFVQAWMREVPVVSLHIDPDGVLDREGVGIHAGSEERLFAAVRMLVTDPVRRAQYAARARQHAMLQHSIQNARLLSQLIDSASVVGR